MERITLAAKLLASEIKTPFYIFDENGFVNNYNNLLGIFRSVYPNYHIAYSYKTNYTPYICNLVKSLDGYAEVVSDMELQLALKLGYSNDRIVYNGPSKGEQALEHLSRGGILNIDSIDEALMICDFCKSKPMESFKCGIRINIDFEDGFISRFGFSTSNNDINDVVMLIESTPNLKLVGMHCHISRHRSIDSWAKRVEIMLKIADRYIKDVPEYISLGSGMFADMPTFLKQQFCNGNVPSYEDYAKAVVEPFAKHYEHCIKKPILFTEPGTTLVARYISFVSKVLSIKNIRDRQIANMDGDYHNLGEICTMKQLPVSVIPGGRKQHVYPNLDVMGFTCLEQDVMYHNFELPLAKDDLLIFNNVGGYSIVSKPQFIKPQSAMYVIHKDGSIDEIMRAETFEDVFSKFYF